MTSGIDRAWCRALVCRLYIAAHASPRGSSEGPAHENHSHLAVAIPARRRRACLSLQQHRRTKARHSCDNASHDVYPGRRRPSGRPGDPLGSRIVSARPRPPRIAWWQHQRRTVSTSTSTLTTSNLNSRWCWKNTRNICAPTHRSRPAWKVIRTNGAARNTTMCSASAAPKPSVKYSAKMAWRPSEWKP